MFALIANQVSLADETAVEALAQIEATLVDTYINWSGATVYDIAQSEGTHSNHSGPNTHIQFSVSRGQ